MHGGVRQMDENALPSMKSVSLLYFNCYQFYIYKGKTLFVYL